MRLQFLFDSAIQGRNDLFGLGEFDDDDEPWLEKIDMVRPFQRAHAGAKLETYRDNEEWVIVIETCHQCESHRQEWLRHDPQDYRPGSQKKSNWTVIEYLILSGIKLCGHVRDVQLLNKGFHVSLLYVFSLCCFLMWIQ